MDKKFLDEVIRLSFAIERTVASDLDNTYCRSARVLAHELHELAAQQSVQSDGDLVIRDSAGVVTCKVCGTGLDVS